METSSHNMSGKDTFFAPAEKAGEDEFRHEISIISKNPVIDSIIDNVSGLLAVLNKYRQVVSVNNALLRMLGITNAEEALGLRPGEVFKCIHCDEPPHGCGTTKYCSTCGAAIAMVTSLESGKPVKRVCAMTAKRDGTLVDLYLQVQACTIVIDNEPFILLFMQDVTDDQQRAGLERAFYHDIVNLIQSIASSAYILNMTDDENKKGLGESIQKLAIKLSKEIEIQRALSRSENSEYRLNIQKVTLDSIVQEVQGIIVNLPARTGKHLRVSDIPDITLYTDSSLVSRILTNMLINAFEATSKGKEVKFELKPTENGVTFQVWNGESIPDDVALRVFQRNYSTKKESGRGLGTYVMKLFGEKYLGGKVDFTTSKEAGTTFSFTLPMEPPTSINV